jgi:hypothetical protein
MIIFVKKKKISQEIYIKNCLLNWNPDVVDILTRLNQVPIFLCQFRKSYGSKEKTLGDWEVRDM